MTTATVPIEITCPDWCVRTAVQHAEDLWNMEGNCIHYSADRTVTDTVGYEEAMRPAQLHSPVEFFMTSMTDPENRETASPILHLEGRELSMAQALQLAEALREVVYTYRVEGGVA